MVQTFHAQLHFNKAADRPLTQPNCVFIVKIVENTRICQQF